MPTATMKISSVWDLGARHGRNALAWVERRKAAGARSFISRLAQGQAPIVLGPWVTEVGFELLYWIPFLAWAQREFALDPERLVVVSRGGTASWYRHITRRYVEIFDLISASEFVEANRRRIEAARGRVKSYAVAETDLDLVERTRALLGVPQLSLLPPSLMYTFYRSWWQGGSPTDTWHVENHSRYARLAPPESSLAPDLPEEFVAVKFYFSNAFPDTRANRDFVATLVRDLAARTPVVLLNGNPRLDDHVECDPGRMERVTTVGERMTPSCNLALQTEIVSRAKAFVGTYGGLSYVAPLLGVNAIAFYSERRFKEHHLALAHRIFASLGGASFSVLGTGALPAVGLLSPSGPRP
jgi:hypothetical protein